MIPKATSIMITRYSFLTTGHGKFTEITSVQLSQYYFHSIKNMLLSLWSLTNEAYL